MLKHLQVDKIQFYSNHDHWGKDGPKIGAGGVRMFLLVYMDN